MNSAHNGESTMKRWTKRIGNAVVVGVIASAPLHAAAPAIRTFDRTGQLSFQAAPSATVYRVQWATSPTGTWHYGAPGVSEQPIPESGSTVVTVGVAQVSGFYRLSMTITSDAPDPLADMVLVPGGTNTGTDPDTGAYSLTVAPFYMDRYEVTKARWDEIHTWAITNGYTFDNAGSGKAANHPVYGVNWYDCVKWCNARSEMLGLLPAYYTNEAMTEVYRTGSGYYDWSTGFLVDVPLFIDTEAGGHRLPTGAQWSYAARGGETNYRFPWGNTIMHEQANYYSDSDDSYDISSTRGYHPAYQEGATPYTSPVGTFAPNGYGLYDMAGNVWEWCCDWLPTAENMYRITHGGSWADLAHNARISATYDDLPDAANGYIGFRTVRPE